MSEIFRELYSLHVVNYVGIEDFSDQLNFLYTSTLLSAFCTLTIFRTYFMRPISCHLTTIVGDMHDDSSLHRQTQYVNDFCWTVGTYAVSPSKFSIDNSLDDGGMSKFKDNKITYYQWVPFVLAIQGVCFCVPRLLWHLISYDRAGTDVGHIIRITKDASNADGEKHDKLLNHACRLVEQMLERNTSKKKTRIQRLGQHFRNCISRLMPARLSGSWLIFTYFIIKIAYLTNAICQLLAMQRFLQLDSSRYPLFGMSLLTDIIVGRDWQNTMVFPRVGCCAIFMRTGAHGNWEFAQCTLPVNMINEKIYIFLWFWFIFVLIATACSIFTWIVRLFNAGIASNFVTRYMKLADNYHEQLKSNAHIDHFVNKFLATDGTFILKMVAINCGDTVCAEMMQGLWQMYKKQLQCNTGCNADCTVTVNPSAPPESAADDDPREVEGFGVLRLGCENLPARSASVKRRRSVLYPLWRKLPQRRHRSEIDISIDSQQHQPQQLGHKAAYQHSTSVI